MVVVLLIVKALNNELRGGCVEVAKEPTVESPRLAAVSVGFFVRLFYDSD